MARQTTTIAFEEAVDRMLRLYAKASGMKLAVIVNRAAEAYIKSELAHNGAVQARYETEEALFLGSAGVPMITKRKPRKNAGVGVENGKESHGQK